MEKRIRDQPLETYRYERKFLVEEMDDHHIRAIVRVHPALFVMPYPPRWVNNIYLDTPELDNYQDNVNGAVDRRKIRLRWYHQLFGEIPKTTLEFKIKRGLVGRKVQFPLGRLQFEKGFTRFSLAEFFKIGGLPDHVQLILSGQIPVLVNRYRRWYFATTDGRFRLTVDTEMSFYHIGLLDNTLRFQHTDHRRRVVELKYQQADDPEAGRIASMFPFSVYKNSKYVLGMESVYW